MEKPWRKLSCIVLVVGLCVTTHFGSVYAQTTDFNDSQITEKTYIDPDIYQMINDYERGTFVERNEDEDINAKQILDSFGTTSETSTTADIKYLYDVKELDSNTYAATRIALYSSLRQENQDEKNGVIVFCRIVYEQKDFGKPWGFLKLTGVESGVVRNNDNYWCEFLKMRYRVYGSAYDANGNRLGVKGRETDYNDTATVNSPTVGHTYSINGPNDYYYSMGEMDSVIAGFARANISFRLSSSEYLEVSSAIQAI